MHTHEHDTEEDGQALGLEKEEGPQVQGNGRRTATALAQNAHGPNSSARTEVPMVRDTIRGQKPGQIQRPTPWPEHRYDAPHSLASSNYIQTPQTWLFLVGTGQDQYEGEVCEVPRRAQNVSWHSSRFGRGSCKGCHLRRMSS